MNVISIPQELFGETISKKSIRLVDNDTSPQIILQDDGYGNLYDVGLVLVIHKDNQIQTIVVV